MTKQEEIREGLRAKLFELGVTNKGFVIRQILEYLHSQGVVLKVDRELPFPMCTVRMNDPRYQDGAMIHAQKLMLEAGYVAVEPLIKPESSNK